MKKHAFVAAFAAVLFALPSFAAAQAADDDAQIAALLARIEALKAQLAAMQEGIAVGEPWEWEFDRSGVRVHIGAQTSEAVEYDEDDIVNYYRLIHGKLYEDYGQTKQFSRFVEKDDQMVWDMFLAVAGEEFANEHVRDLVTYRDADTGLLAYVDRYRDEEPSWALVVNANAADSTNRKWVRDMGVVLVHEYAHMLTLGEDQVQGKKSRAYCKKGGTFYQNGYGCLEEDSYFNHFIHRFWTQEEYDLALESFGNGETDEFYEGREDEYVTEYAASRPVEDVAESFTEFILRKKPTGTKEKDEKVLFFYKYPELVELRERMRADIADFFD